MCHSLCSHRFHNDFNLQKCDRTIGSLQSKYKNLKMKARKQISEAKRDLVRTGNKQLSTRTVDTLRDSNMLLALRERMGATATGFQSKSCKYLFVYNTINSRIIKSKINIITYDYLRKRRYMHKQIRFIIIIHLYM